jgi:hypothetical protein
VHGLLAALATARRGLLEPFVQHRERAGDAARGRLGSGRV